MIRRLLPLLALVLPLAAARPAPAQVPSAGSFAQGYADLSDLIRQLGDVRSLGIDPRLGGAGSGLGTSGSILAYAQTLNRQIGRLADLRTLGNPAAEAQIASIVRRHQILGRISEGMAAEQRVRNGVQQHQLKVQYEQVAAQARNLAGQHLHAARQFAARGDYENAKAAFVWHLYYNQVAREYGAR
jgi:hypothetical protein